MKVSSLEDFAESNWEPVKNSRELIFHDVGMQTVFIKFRDKDGFVSDVYQDEIDVKIFGANGEHLIINENQKEMLYNMSRL